MKIKTYTSDSVPKALSQIRQEMGPGALILNTKKTRKKKLLGLMPAMTYEITAAADTSLEELEQQLEEESSRQAVPAQSEEGLDTYEVATTPPAPRQYRPQMAPALSSSEESSLDSFSNPEWQTELKRLNQEIVDLKRLVSRPVQSDSMNWTYMQDEILRDRFQKIIGRDQNLQDWKSIEAVSREFQALLTQGINIQMASLLVQQASLRLPEGQDVRDRVRIRLNKAITDRVQTAPIGFSSKDARAAIFIGPTGVGKTTTIAKLAALFALKERKKVRLLTLDTFRIAAAEQLKTYGEIIGVPVKVIFSVDELDQALANMGSDDYFLIDTSGVSPQKLDDFSELSSYLKESQRVEKHLVLSTATHPQSLEEAVDAFGVFQPDKLIFTKLDESSTFGVLFNEVMRTHKPVSYLTNGQTVPEDLVIPTSKQIADLIVPFQ